jgi:hypothetical protein
MGFVIVYKILQGIVQCHPMNNFECKPSRERESNYGAYMCLNQYKEINWKKVI